MTKKLLKSFGPWAIITGASSGIGEGFTNELASKGFNLGLTARRSDFLEKIRRRLFKRFAIQYKVVAVGMFRPKVQETIIEGCNVLDIGLLVSNAGTGRLGRFTNRKEQDLSEIIQVNGLCHIWLSHYFSKNFALSGSGGIILTGAMGLSKEWRS